MANINSASVKALANRIVGAVGADEKSEGCDISAGMFGKHFSDLVIDLATLLEAAKALRDYAKATDEYGDFEAELEEFEELVERIEQEKENDQRQND